MRVSKSSLQLASIRYKTVLSSVFKISPRESNRYGHLGTSRFIPLNAYSTYKSDSSRSGTRQFKMASSSRSGVRLIGSLQHTQQEHERPRSKYDVLQLTGSRTEFLQHCKQGKSNHVVGLYPTNSTKKTGPFDKELVYSLPASLKHICLNGAGYDGMDISACREKHSYLEYPKCRCKCYCRRSNVLASGRVATCNNPCPSDKRRSMEGRDPSWT